MAEQNGEISPFWILYPFNRALPLNLIAIGGTVAVWLVGFHAGIQFFGTESLATADSAAGRMLRFRAGVVSAVLLGGYVSVLTVGGFGWPVWNLALGLFVPAFVGDVWFYLMNLPVPHNFYNTSGYYNPLPEAIGMMGLGGSYIVSLMVVTYVLARIYFRTDERKIAWLKRLPK